MTEVDLLDGGARIHAGDALAQRLLLFLAHQIGLGHQDAVGKPDLLLRLAEFIQLLGRMLGIHQRQDTVEQVVIADVLIHEKGLRHRTGIGHAGGLDDDAVELELAALALVAQLTQNAHQVTTHGAADAAVVHFNDLLLAVIDEDFIVDTRFAELVLDHRNALTVLFLEDAVEQRGFATAEKAGEDGHRNHVLLLLPLLRHRHLCSPNRAGRN